MAAGRSRAVMTLLRLWFLKICNSASSYDALRKGKKVLLSENRLRVR